MSETYIEIDSLQHLEISRQTCPTRAMIESVKNPRYNIHCFNVMLIFRINADNTYIHHYNISV